MPICTSASINVIPRLVKSTRPGEFTARRRLDTLVRLQFGLEVWNTVRMLANGCMDSFRETPTEDLELARQKLRCHLPCAEGMSCSYFPYNARDGFDLLPVYKSLVEERDGSPAFQARLISHIDPRLKRRVVERSLQLAVKLFGRKRADLFADTFHLWREGIRKIRGVRGFWGNGVRK